MYAQACTPSSRLAHCVCLILAFACGAAQAADTPDETPAQTLGKIKVEAGADDTTEGTGSYGTQAVSVGGKTARDPKQIQQSVTVVTHQRIQDQNLTSVVEALGQATGITLATTNYQSIYSRGFEISSLQFDGGSPANINNYADYSGLPDLATFDHIEVLRGSDGLFAGVGEAGGTVNAVRKRPLGYSQIKFDTLAGRWDRYRAQVDVTGPFGDSGVRGRFVAAQEERDFFYGNGGTDKTVLYGIVEADLGENTLVTLGARHERDDTDPNYTGLPRYSDGADLQLSRDACICADWSRWNTTTTEIFAKLEQSLAADWKLKLNVSQQRKHWDAKFAYPFGGVDPFTQAGPILVGTRIDYQPRQTLADATLNGSFEAFGMEQEVLLGANWQNMDGSRYRQSLLYSSFPSVNVPAFDPSAYPEPSDTAYWNYIYSALGQEQSGVYASLRSRLTPALHSILGVRYSKYRYGNAFNIFDNSTGELSGSSELRFKESGVATPYAGLTYDLTKAISVYASYAQIFKPQGDQVTAAGNALKPITGDSYEVGAKGSWLDGALSASVAVYRIKRNNEGFQTDDSGSFGNLSCCYVATTEVGSKGFDAEVTGQLSPGWQVFAGYTYNINEYEHSDGAKGGTAFFPQTPKHLFKLWTMAQLPGALSDWRIGGGLNAQTKNHADGSASTFDSTGAVTGEVPYRFTQGGYAVASLRGEYRITERWSAALNIDNVFDRTYYQTVGSAGAHNFYGEPRNFTLSVSGNY